MTQVPPPRIPGASREPVPCDLALDAWALAYVEHCRRVRAEERRYARECAGLRERFGPPAGRPVARGPALYQATLDEVPVR